MGLGKHPIPQTNTTSTAHHCPAPSARTMLGMLAFADLTALAQEHGLIAAACMPVPTTLDPAGLDQLLADGVGDMTYLQRHRDLRLSPHQFAPSARSLVVALLAYQPQARSIGSLGLQRARYAAGKDYHQLFRKRLARLGQAIDDRANPGHNTASEHRATVDSAPVNERQLAQLAGLGWIGKNALLLRERQGSYFFIGCLFTSTAIEYQHGGQAADRCGSCSACEQACPTAALTQRRVLSERCISYLTIEHHGVIARDLAVNFQGWWYGCDRCQEVCPWNRFAPPASEGRLTGSDDESDLMHITSHTFDSYFAGRAVRRIGYERFRRNLLVALWSLGHHDQLSPLLSENLPLVSQQAAELGLPMA